MKFYKKESNIFYIYFQIIKKYKGYMEEGLKDYNLTQAEIDVLTYLVNNKDSDITAKDIGMHRGISKGLVSRAVTSLVEKKIVKTTINPNDGRSLHLSLEDLNMEMIKEVELLNDTFKNILLEGLDMEDFNIFLKINNKMLSNVDIL